MDKNLFYNNVQSKRGFALMITLSVLTVVIALTMVLLSYFEEVQDDASQTQSLIQSNIYYSDLIKIFQRFPDKKLLFSTLYLAPLPLNSPDSGFSIMLKCDALSSGVNINWLGMQDDSSMSKYYDVAQKVFFELAQQYDIEDVDRLYEMIIKDIGSKDNSIIKEYNNLLQKRGILSYKQLERVISNYQFEVDDDKVTLIPWKKYFSFSYKSKLIDIEYGSPELISLLFDIDLEIAQEWHNDLEHSSLKSFVGDNGSNYNKLKDILVGSTFLEESECDVSFAHSKNQYQFSFKYIKGKAKDFEFYGKL